VLRRWDQGKQVKKARFTGKDLVPGDMYYYTDRWRDNVLYFIISTTQADGFNRVSVTYAWCTATCFLVRTSTFDRSNDFVIDAVRVRL
jgi:hypothetical protein